MRPLATDRGGVTMDYELGEVMAERHIDAIAGDGSFTTVVLRIGQPRPDPLPGGDWECTRQILGLGDEAVDASFGVDSLQALLLCVHGLNLELTERADIAAVRLNWLGQPDLALKVDPEVHKLLPPGS